MKITNFEYFQWPFIYWNRAFRRKLKNIQIWLKCMQMRHEINTINFGSRYCNGKNTYRLLACEYAWKRVHFRRSKCCFARVMDAKVVRNHTPSSEIYWILTRKLLEFIKNPRKRTHLIAIRFLVAIRTMRKNVEIRENLRKLSCSERFLPRSAESGKMLSMDSFKFEWFGHILFLPPSLAIVRVPCPLIGFENVGILLPRCGYCMDLTACKD